VTYIPLEALFQQGDRPIAYLHEGVRFRARPLTLGERNKDKVVVRKGLKPGQRIAMVPPPGAMIRKESGVKGQGSEVRRASILTPGP
jgi:hypothetical protein